MSGDDQFLSTIKKIALKANSRKNRSKKNEVYSNYVRPNVTTQDKISENPKLIKEKLEGFVQIDRDDYKHIPPGTFIRYLKYLPGNRVKYCHGGVLAFNAAPVYWILSNKIPNEPKRCWSVQLQNNNIYYRKSENTQIPNQSIKEMCDMITSGEYRLIKTELLLKLPSNLLIKLLDDSDAKKQNRASEQDNSDEDSTTLESDEDSDESRRPTTIVHLV